MQPVDVAKRIAARRRSPYTEAHWVPRTAEHAMEPLARQEYAVAGRELGERDWAAIDPMLVRISKGHTGRKVVFDAGDKLVLWIMLTALVLRVVLPQLVPAAYGRWVHLSAGAWFLGFGILGLRLLPRLIAPRIDGKEH